MSAGMGMGSTAAELSSSYLNLLVTQLRNQNPLEPMSNNEMAAQLAQLSQLEQMETLNGQFRNVLQAVQTHEAAALVGREVRFMVTDEQTGASQVQQGTVERAAFEDGRVVLHVGAWQVDADELLSVQ